MPACELVSFDLNRFCISDRLTDSGDRQVHNQENCIEVIQQALLQQLAYVCANGGPDQMRTLVDCGADLNTMHMASGQYPLSVAAARKDPQMVRALRSDCRLVLHVVASASCCICSLA